MCCGGKLVGLDLIDRFAENGRPLALTVGGWGGGRIMDRVSDPSLGRTGDKR